MAGIPGVTAMLGTAIRFWDDGDAGNGGYVLALTAMLRVMAARRFGIWGNPAAGCAGRLHEKPPLAGGGGAMGGGALRFGGGLLQAG